MNVTLVVVYHQLVKSLLSLWPHVSSALGGDSSFKHAGEPRKTDDKIFEKKTVLCCPHCPFIQLSRTELHVSARPGFIDVIDR
jgi:hypothetical protein